MVDLFFDFTGLFGDSHGDPIEKAKTFKKELQIIDKKYIDFFKNRKSPLPDQEHDSLFNHCKVYLGYNPVKFFFTDDIVPNLFKESVSMYLIKYLHKQIGYR